MIKILFTLSLLSISFGSVADTLFEKQWALNNTGQSILVTSGELTRFEKTGVKGQDIGHDKAQISKIANKEELIVAVIDSGLDTSHPDLKGRLWFNKKICENLNEEERKTKPCYGWNFINSNSDLRDTIGHGTHVSGIIAANNNDIGIAGITPKQVKIMPLKVISNEIQNFIHNGRLVTDIFADAMAFAIHNGAKVINLSLGWPKIIETPKIRAAFDRARKQGIAVIAASGNNGKDIPTFPCTYKDVICVGSHDNQGLVSTFSNFGGKVDILAPGEFIVSTYPEELESRSLRIQSYEDKQGSSQAAPFVTGTVANIWLKNPTYSLDQVKAQLFSSTTPMNDGSSLFGKLNLKKALTKNLDVFTAPIFKDVLNVIVSGDGKFNIAVPVKNYLLAREKVMASVGLGELVELEKENFELSLNPGEPTTLIISGKLKALNIDSHQTLKITIDENEYLTKVVFNRDIKTLTPTDTISLEGATPELIAFFNSRRKGSLLRNVIVNNTIGEEYYYFPNIREQDKSSVTILKRKNKKFELKNISHPEGAEIISIYKRDLNFDKSEDYLIYAKKGQTLYLWFLNNDLRPLYGKRSLWQSSVEQFGGLPESPTEERFSWIKKKNSELGNILTPLFVQEGLMPEKDNSKHPLDKVSGFGKRNYYLNPVSKGSKTEMELRVVDSFSLLEKIATELDLYFDDAINLSNPLPQTKSDIAKGIVNFTLSVGKEFSMRNFKLSFSSTNTYKRSPLFTDFIIDRNNIFPLFDLKTGEISLNKYKYVTLYNRQDARIATLPGSSDEAFELSSSSWQDPIANYVTGFTSSNETIDLIETRKSIYALKNGKRVSSLPLYRESSLPSLAFSETYKPFVLGVENSRNRPALFVDSTLVFGDQNYVMVWNEKTEELTRPISLSFIIPRECISLGPVRDGNHKSLALQCYEGKDKPMTIKLYPLTLNQ